MANARECKACREAQARKHRFDDLWKIWAIFATILAIVFICLYFTSGDVVKETTINNDVEITNMGGDAMNENIANINSESGNNTTAIVVFSVLGALLIIGGIYGAYIISQGHHKQSCSDREQGSDGNDKEG